MLIKQTRFERSDLIAICGGIKNILVVKKYASPDLCVAISSRIKKSVYNHQTSGSSIYVTDAMPFFNAVQNDEKYRVYFCKSLNYMRNMRDTFSPYLSPTDKIRLDLDEIWPYGAGVMDINGQKMLFGIARIWASGSEGLPHQDVLHREIPYEPKAASIERQFGINIYLTSPEQGGEIEIWNRAISDSEWNEMNVPGSYGYSRDILPKERTVIKPEAGDLIMFNTHNVHAIKPTTLGERITISGFMAYFGMDRPIELWS